MRVLILWWRRGERREGGGSERQSGMDGKSRDLLAGIKRVFETRAECSHTRWRYLCFDEKVVAFVQPEITLFFSLSLSVHLSAFLYHNMDFSITVLQTVPRDPWIDGSKFLSRNFNPRSLAQILTVYVFREMFISPPQKKIVLDVQTLDT